MTRIAGLCVVRPAATSLVAGMVLHRARVRKGLKDVLQQQAIRGFLPLEEMAASEARHVI